MSYDISLKDPVTKETIEVKDAHFMQGGTYALGGTHELWLNVTYNYGKIFRRPEVLDVEITTTENYDKEAAKALMRATIAKADEVSAAVDAAMINTVVEYEPPYDVNESFDDVLEAFAASHVVVAVGVDTED